MNTRTTVILFLIVAGLGALILGVERYFPSAQELREIKRGPARFEKDKITRVEVLNSENTPLTLVRDGAAWRMEAPFPDVADPQHVAALILTLDGV